MSEKSPNKQPSSWQAVLWIGGGAAIGTIGAGVLAGLLGADGGIPWPGIGSGIGAMTGVILLNRRTPK